jgi:hypothetical protein
MYYAAVSIKKPILMGRVSAKKYEGEIERISLLSSVSIIAKCEQNVYK